MIVLIRLSAQTLRYLRAWESNYCWRIQPYLGKNGYMGRVIIQAGVTNNTDFPFNLAHKQTSRLTMQAQYKQSKTVSQILCRYKVFQLNITNFVVSIS